MSHSWRASRTLKWLAILRHLNLCAATGAAFFTALIMFAFQLAWRPLLYRPCPTSAFGYTLKDGCAFPAAPLGGSTYIAAGNNAHTRVNCNHKAHLCTDKRPIAGVFVLVFFSWHNIKPLLTGTERTLSPEDTTVLTKNTTVALIYQHYDKV